MIHSLKKKKHWAYCTLMRKLEKALKKKKKKNKKFRKER